MTEDKPRPPRAAGRRASAAEARGDNLDVDPDGTKVRSAVKRVAAALDAAVASAEIAAKASALSEGEARRGSEMSEQDGGATLQSANSAAVAARETLDKLEEARDAQQALARATSNARRSSRRG